MLGSAVSSSTPIDFQPRSTMGFSDFPLMNRQAFSPGPTHGCPYCAVGMHRALESAIGLPSSSTSVSRMLVLVTPPDVRRSFKVPPDSISIDGVGIRTWHHRETHRLLNEANVSARWLSLRTSASRARRRTPDAPHEPADSRHDRADRGRSGRSDRHGAGWPSGWTAYQVPPFKKMSWHFTSCLPSCA